MKKCVIYCAMLLKPVFIRILGTGFMAELDMKLNGNEAGLERGRGRRERKKRKTGMAFCPAHCRQASKND